MWEMQEGTKEVWAAVFQGICLPPSAEKAYLGRAVIIPPGIFLQNWKLVGSLKGYKFMLKWENLVVFGIISFKGGGGKFPEPLLQTLRNENIM